MTQINTPPPGNGQTFDPQWYNSLTNIQLPCEEIYSYLITCFKYTASKNVFLFRNKTKDLQILRIMWHIEDPEDCQKKVKQNLLWLLKLISEWINHTVRKSICSHRLHLKLKKNNHHDRIIVFQSQIFKIRQHFPKLKYLKRWVDILLYKTNRLKCQEPRLWDVN